jgi:hypothetical protein
MIAIIITFIAALLYPSSSLVPVYSTLLQIYSASQLAISQIWSHIPNSVYYEYHSYLNSTSSSSIAVATNFFDSIEELNEYRMPELTPVDVQTLVQLFQLDSSPEVSGQISSLLQELSEDAHTVQEHMKVLIGKGKMEVQMIALAVCLSYSSHPTFVY